MQLQNVRNMAKIQLRYISNALIECESLQRETVSVFATCLFNGIEFMIEINAIELKISCVFSQPKKTTTKNNL